jgi:3'(2'), 5'-bisphosphate nucleotidase
MTPTDSCLTIAITAALSAGREIMEVYMQPSPEVQLKDDLSPLTLADRRAHEVIAELLSGTTLPVLSEEGRTIPYEERRHWRRFWLVDPLDGTKEFIRKNGEFTVNIALVEEGIPVLGVVYAPVIGQLWFGLQGAGAWRADTATLSVAEDLVAAGIPLPMPASPRPYRVVGSRSHMNEETRDFIASHLSVHPLNEIVSRGSSIKLCMIAEGSADIYPRFCPTMEWDTAAGHAVIAASGGTILQSGNEIPLQYNKYDLLNPWFIASRQGL